MLITGRIRNVIKAVQTHVFFYIRREMLLLDQSFCKISWSYKVLCQGNDKRIVRLGKKYSCFKIILNG